jgi:cytoskeletal protein CcmA (bactofilin family)
MADDTVLSGIDQKDIIAMLGKGSEFEGKLTFEGVVRIDGRFTGEIFSKGILIIGENAKVKAEIQVSTVVIKGEMTGNVKAPTCVELHAPARLIGNLVTPCLYVQKGVVFEGHTIMESEGIQKASGRSGLGMSFERSAPPPLPG